MRGSFLKGFSNGLGGRVQRGKLLKDLTVKVAMGCKCRARLLMVLRVGLVGHIPEIAESRDRRSNVVWHVRRTCDCGHTSLLFKFDLFGIRKEFVLPEKVARVPLPPLDRVLEEGFPESFQQC